MRSNGYSLALREYEASLLRARRLQQLEAMHFSDPPPPQDRVAVEGLRGGAVVLMVASFERYLREALEEFVDLIAKRALLTSRAGLSADFAEFNDFNYFNWLIRYSRMSRSQQRQELKRVAQLVSTNNFVPEAFSQTRANPGPTTVKQLFREFGISNAFQTIEQHFERHFRKPFPPGFVEQTLSGIVSIRNQVAHGGFSLSIGRDDLRGWVSFLNAFGKAADNTLRNHTLNIIGSL
jgi:hypothetical protein